MKKNIFFTAITIAFLWQVVSFTVNAQCDEIPTSITHPYSAEMVRASGCNIVRPHTTGDIANLEYCYSTSATPPAAGFGLWDACTVSPTYTLSSANFQALCSSGEKLYSHVRSTCNTALAPVTREHTFDTYVCPPVLTATTGTPTPASCGNNGAIPVSWNNGNNSITITWTGTGVGSSGSIGGQTGFNYTISNLPPGTYTVTVTDACETVTAGSDIVVQNTRPTSITHPYSFEMVRASGCNVVRPHTTGDITDLEYCYSTSATPPPSNSSLWIACTISPTFTLTPGNFQAYCSGSQPIYTHVRSTCNTALAPVTHKHTFDDYVCLTDYSSAISIGTFLGGTTCAVATTTISISPNYGLCYPVTWDIKEKESGASVLNGTLDTTGETIASSTTSFTREVAYIVSCTDNNGVEFSKEFTPPLAAATTYSGYFFPSPGNTCEPFGTRYLRIAPSTSYFYPGTTIRYEYGNMPLAMGAVGTTVTITSASQSYYYPTTSGLGASATYVDLIDGTYRFIVTPPAGCGSAQTFDIDVTDRDDTYDPNNQNFTVVNIAQNCTVVGIRMNDNIKLRSGANATTYYYISGNGISQTVSPGENIILPVSDIPYTISMYPSSTSCPMVTKDFLATAPQVGTATINYGGSPYPAGVSTPMSVSFTGTTGGTYSATPSGLDINPSTGAVTPATSTPGSYTVTYTLAAAGGCKEFTTTATVNVVVPPSCDLLYSGSATKTYNQSETTPQFPDAMGSIYVGGIYSATPGGLTLNASTGAITPSSSTAGDYTVSYKISGIEVATATVTINAAFNAGAITTGNPFVCSGDDSAMEIGSTTDASGGLGTITYEWYKNDVAIASSNNATYYIPTADRVNNGNSNVVIDYTRKAKDATYQTTFVASANTYTLTVYPTPTVTKPTDQTKLNGESTDAINFTGNIASGVTYNWTNNNTAIGLAASGTGDIASFTATNTTYAPISATITVTPTVGSCPGSSVSFTITVGAAVSLITVTANSGSSSYGESPANPGFTATGLLPGDDESVLTGLSNSFGITSATEVGTYTLEVIGTLSNAKYTVTDFYSGQWTVNPANITVTANSGSSNFGESPTNPGLSFSGLPQNFDESLLADLYNDFSITSDTPAGTYTLYVGGDFSDSNFNLLRNSGIWVVKQLQGYFEPLSVFRVVYSPTLTLANVILPEGYKWNSPGASLKPGNNQIFAATYTDPSGNHTTVSGTLQVNVRKADGAEVSGPPTLNGLATESSIAVNTLTIPDNPGNQTVEYAISTNGALLDAPTPASLNGLLWQFGTTFTGAFSENTNYYGYARSASNTYYLSGPAQVSATIKVGNFMGLVETGRAPSQLTAWIHDGTLYVSGLTPGKPWRIYNILGTLIYQGIANNVVETRHATSLRIGRGVYIIMSEGKTVKIIEN